MDRFAEKQAQIHRQRDQLLARYPALWKALMTEWQSPAPEDRGWMIYSANYLFRTGDIGWAIDPLTFYGRLRTISPKVDLTVLGTASFILLTHRHADHLDLGLISALRQFPVRWVVPEFLMEEVIGHGSIPCDRVIVPRPLHTIELNGISIVPFEGAHWETTSEGILKGVPSMGYLVEFNGRRWLFPGDVRTYDAARLPVFGPVDILFAHLWLGRGCALRESHPLLEEFCRFCLDLRPRRIILTHLHEFGRDAREFWDETHLPVVFSRFQELSPDTPVHAAQIGESFLL